MASGTLNQEKAQEMKEVYETLDPVTFRKELDRATMEIYGMAECLNEDELEFRSEN